MQMSEDEFSKITPRSFNNKLTGFRRKQQDASKEAWERTRALGVLLLSPNLKKGSKADPLRIWPLPWDKEPDSMIADPKEAHKKAVSMWEEIDKKRASASLSDQARKK